MEDNRQYLQIMIESLQKKQQVLDAIMRANDRQTAILHQDEADWEAFDEYAEQKTELIDQLDQLDDGFESLYNHIKEALSDDAGRTAYQNEIRQMQDLIRELTEKSMSIQASEARNKQLVEQKFARQRQQLKTGRLSSKAAMDYYKNMRQTGNLQAQFLDSKK